MWLFVLIGVVLVLRARAVASAANSVIDEPNSVNVERLIRVVRIVPVGTHPEDWNRARNAFVEANKSQCVLYEQKEALKKALMRRGLRGIENIPIIKTKMDLGKASVGAATTAPRGLTTSDVNVAGQHLSKAEKIIHIDPEAAMNYCRKFLESATKGLLEINGIVVSRENNLYERILLVESSSLADQELCSLMHEIRTVTNRYSHTEASDGCFPTAQEEQEILEKATNIVAQCRGVLQALRE